MSMTYWHVANENPGHMVMEHVFMFVNNSVKKSKSILKKFLVFIRQFLQ